MTKIYKVTGVKVRFGPGFVLELEKSQADARAHALYHNKGNLYSVLDQVEFKQGEVIGISQGDIPKSWWDTLEEVVDKKAKKPSSAAKSYSIQHRHFGKYDVIDAAGNIVTEEPLPKDDALAYLEDLSGVSEA
jgi:L-rhamnose mutarotase